MLSVAEMRDHILAMVAKMARLPSHMVPLERARGCRLAQPVLAPVPLPRFTNAAMDGYAVRAADTPGVLPIAATISAGQVPEPLLPGTAAKIMTGAMLPPGADAIVMWEDVTLSDAGVAVPRVSPAAHVRAAGEDIAPGTVAIAARCLVGPGEIAMAAALGYSQLCVVRPPSVSIVATGNELVSPGHAVGPATLVNSSTPMLMAAVADAGGFASAQAPVRDEPHALAAALQFASTSAQANVIITTGGVSAGEFDLVRSAVAAAGGRVDLWKVAMKPGKPFCVGTLGQALWFGLPGNPVSTWVTFELFVRPVLRILGGHSPWRRRINVVSPIELRAGDRTTFVRARWRRGCELGPSQAQLVERQGSGDLSSLVDVDLLLEVPAHTRIGPGAPVAAWLLREP